MEQAVAILMHSCPSLLPPGSSYAKRGQGDNRTAVEDSGRKGSSGSSTTKVPASPLVPSDRKKSATPSTVSSNTKDDIFYIGKSTWILKIFFFLNIFNIVSVLSLFIYTEQHLVHQHCSKSELSTVGERHAGPGDPERQGQVPTYTQNHKKRKMLSKGKDNYAVVLIYTHAELLRGSVASSPTHP